MADSPDRVGAAPRQDHRTLLHMAVLGGHAEAARALLEAKADVDARNEVSRGGGRYWP